MRVVVLLACLVLASGCPRSAGYPASIAVHAYAAPAGGGAPFVLAYDPWTHGAPAVTASGAEVLAPVEEVTLRCANTPCEIHAEAVVLGHPAAGVDHVELVVERPGFAPRRIAIPFAGTPAYAVRVVLLAPEATP